VTLPGIDDPTLVTWALLAGIFLFAGLVHGTLGLGFPMTATPLLALVTDMRSAILITLLPTMAVNIISIARGGRWRDSLGRYWPLAVYAAIGATAGAQTLLHVDPAPFKVLLAGVILLYLNLHRLKGVDLRWVPRHPSWALLGFGLVAGFLAGSVNVMVPVLIMLFLELGVAPTAMVQVFNMCFLTGKLVQTGVFIQAGTMSGAIALATAPLAVAGVIALGAGMVIRSRVQADTYRRWLRAMLWLFALGLVGQYLAGW
jgi:hypothetical protein